MSNLERLKQRLEESLEKHKNRLLKTRYKKANGFIDENAKKSTNNTVEGTNRTDKGKNEVAKAGGVKKATTGRNEHGNVYSGNSLEGKLNGRLRSSRVPQVRGRKENKLMPSRPLKEKLQCKANSSRRVIPESRSSGFGDRKTEGGVGKEVVPDTSEGNHAMEEEPTQLDEEPPGEGGNFDGVSKEIRDNLNDLFRHFINCRINNLYVIHGDRGKIPRGEFSEEGRAVMMIPGVGASEEVQEGVIGDVVGEEKELDVALPDVDGVGHEEHTRGEEEEGLYNRLFHVKGEDVASGVSRKGEIQKETEIIGANVGTREKDVSMMEDGRVRQSRESVEADIGSGRYNSTFIKLMQIKKKIKKKIKKFEDEEKKFFCTEERTMCNSDVSNEDRNLPVRDISTFTDGNSPSSKEGNDWGVVQVHSSVASAASTNQEVSSTGESIELFTTQRNIFVCNYYTKNSRTKKERKVQDRVQVTRDSANFLGSAFSLENHSTVTCNVGGSQLEKYPSLEEYEAHFNPPKLYGSPTYRLDHKRGEGKRITHRRGSHGDRVGYHVMRISNEVEGGRGKRRDDLGKTKYELSSCPSSSFSYQNNHLSPSRGNPLKCLRGQVRRDLTTHMERDENDGSYPTGERHTVWDRRDIGGESHYPNERRPFCMDKSTTRVQGRSKCEVKSIMPCVVNMLDGRYDERKEGENRFPILSWSSGQGVQTSPSVQWEKCNGKFRGEFSSAFSGESGGHCSRPGDNPRGKVPLKGERENPGGISPHLTPSDHQSCEERTKCYICSFPIRNNEEEFILKKKKRDYDMGCIQKGETYKLYKQKEYTSKNCLRRDDSLYRRNECEVSNMPQEDMLIHGGSANSERGRFRCRQTIHGDSGKYSYMADQEGEEKKMESGERYIEIKHRGVGVRRIEDNGHGHGTNFRYHSVREKDKEDEQPDEASFVIGSSGPTYGCNLEEEGSDKREEVILDGGEGFSLQRGIQEGGLQRNIPTCGMKRNDRLSNKKGMSDCRNHPVRVALNERSCVREETFTPGVAPRDVDHLSETYNTWVYKERLSASAERDGVSIGSVVVNESTGEGKPKTLFWKISEGDTFNIPVEGNNAKVLHVGRVGGERPAERNHGFDTEEGKNRRRAASNGAILKKVLRMKMEAMQKEKRNMGEEEESRKLEPSAGLAQAEYSTPNIPNEEKNRLKEYERGERHTHGEMKQKKSGDGERWVYDKLSGHIGVPDVGGSTRSRSTLNRGTVKGSACNSDPPNRLPPDNSVERSIPREMAPGVDSLHVEDCSVRSVSTLERIPLSRKTQRKYSPTSGLTRNVPVRVKKMDTLGPENKNDGDKMEMQRFNESFYCNIQRIRSNDVYPNSEEPISTSQKKRLMKAYLEDLRKKEKKEVFNYKLKYNIEFFKFAQFICQDKNFCKNYLGQMGSNMDANGDDIDRVAFSIVKLFNAR
ncbi:Uncharacterized protein PKNOH_S030339304 [Plasmodium knowlesi]|uniref:Uncharacterized protein n=1 Tax=Plasmodium knowlesi TaxID=5850 RepID=A0A1Y3DXN6_PLAKN|nr:Uncharacterized protein PKNOH_S030339304 [Plasmodium knowlesi]